MLWLARYGGRRHVPSWQKQACGLPHSASLAWPGMHVGALVSPSPWVTLKSLASLHWTGGMSKMGTLVILILSRWQSWAIYHPASPRLSQPKYLLSSSKSLVHWVSVKESLLGDWVSAFCRTKFTWSWRLRWFTQSLLVSEPYSAMSQPQPFYITF